MNKEFGDIFYDKTKEFIFGTTIEIEKITLQFRYNDNVSINIYNKIEDDIPVITLRKTENKKDPEKENMICIYRLMPLEDTGRRILLYETEKLVISSNSEKNYLKEIFIKYKEKPNLRKRK